MDYLILIRDISIVIFSCITVIGIIIFYVIVLVNNRKINKINKELINSKKVIYELKNQDKRINYNGIKITLGPSNDSIPTRDLIQDAIYERNNLIQQKRDLKDEIESYKIFNKKVL
jgi:hypothetical protein